MIRAGPKRSHGSEFVLHIAIRISIWGSGSLFYNNNIIIIIIIITITIHHHCLIISSLGTELQGVEVEMQPFKNMIHHQ